MTNDLTTKKMKFKPAVLSLIALLIFTCYLFAFYPGYMSHDSAYHYSQVESGEWTTFQPVVILLFWKTTNMLIAGPGGMFLLFLLLYLTGLWLLSCYMQGGYISRILLLLLALSPVNIMLFPHIWKDIGLLVFTLLSLGLLLLSQRHLLYLWCSIFSLWIAILFRFEAILYLFPLVYFQGQQYLRLRFRLRADNIDKPIRYRWAVIFVVLFVVASVSGNRLLVSVSNSYKVTLWPTIALWDIARVSIKEEKQLLPAFTVGPGMDVADLAQATQSWTNLSLLANTKAGIHSGLFVPYPAEQYQILLKLWLSLPLRYPNSYFEHRWELLKDLLRFDETPDKPQDLFWINQIIQYGERFPVNNSPLNQKINHWLIQHKDDFYFKPWFYILLALLILLWRLLWRLQWRLLWRRRCEKLNTQQRLADYLLYSAFLSVGVLFFLAPAAEQRYLIILFNFVPLAACLTWAKQDNQ